ncbi:MULTISPECIES: hypothetical protein [Arthrobacter]|uniref:Uncharacterized protein n=1 Tax=Arthrobacter terricola TaxID=2547396 RepID=A0A4R5K6M5_9MICC|nr:MULTISPECIES: hypothetical protein [Arthrobacter]MBT8159320.1 hypothetical protein [Arthrobacter sp. GN70]TDF86876.1 hypothetical protein E1809_25485 [Arthrobacter terricola]
MSEHLEAPEGWTPEFEGQRPPFAPGNELAVKHGARSPRKVDPVAEALAVELLADDALAYLRAPRFAAAVQAWAQAEAKVALVADWLDGMGMEQATQSGQGRMSPLELWRKLDSAAAGHRARLGLDPLSAARLGKDVAQGRQADAAATLTAMREQHERATRGDVVDGGK